MDPRPAPDEIDFEALVEAALDDLPEAYRQRLGSVAIVVEDQASPAQLATSGARGLYGLYQGVPRTAYGAENAAAPSKITIFRLPHLQAYGTRFPRAAVAGTVRPTRSPTTSASATCG
jgi:predicted Zn-dependent protease with MMP-like domain